MYHIPVSSHSCQRHGPQGAKGRYVRDSFSRYSAVIHILDCPAFSLFNFAFDCPSQSPCPACCRCPPFIGPLGVLTLGIISQVFQIVKQKFFNLAFDCPVAAPPPPVAVAVRRSPDCLGLSTLGIIPYRFWIVKHKFFQPCFWLSNLCPFA